MNTHILHRVSDGVLRVTLRRPERRNALTGEMCRTLISVFEEAERDAEVGAILLDAEGDDFCAGLDLDEAATDTSNELMEAHARLFTLGGRLRVPVVAAVHGHAVGGGLGLGLVAHIMVAAEDAVLGTPEIGLGIWPYAVFHALAAAVGERYALKMAMTGQSINAREALARGLVDRVVCRDELGSASSAVAAAVSSRNRVALRDGMDFVISVREISDDERLREVARRRKLAVESSAFRSSLLERRTRRGEEGGGNT